MVQWLLSHHGGWGFELFSSLLSVVLPLCSSKQSFTPCCLPPPIPSQNQLSVLIYRLCSWCAGSKFSYVCYCMFVPSLRCFHGSLPSSLLHLQPLVLALQTVPTRAPLCTGSENWSGLKISLVFSCDGFYLVQQTARPGHYIFGWYSGREKGCLVFLRRTHLTVLASVFSGAP